MNLVVLVVAAVLEMGTHRRCRSACQSRRVVCGIKLTRTSFAGYSTPDIGQSRQFGRGSRTETRVF